VVIEKLGEPDEIAIGDFAGVAYYYYEDSFPAMEIIIMGAPLIGVENLMVDSPYSGTTQDGIGIGSTRTEALPALSQPDQSISGYIGIIDHYYFNNTEFTVNYFETDTILSIMMRAN
jgi:hypothetical protein